MIAVFVQNRPFCRDDLHRQQRAKTSPWQKAKIFARAEKEILLLLLGNFFGKIVIRLF